MAVLFGSRWGSVLPTYCPHQFLSSPQRPVVFRPVPRSLFSTERIDLPRMGDFTDFPPFPFRYRFGGPSGPLCPPMFPFIIMVPGATPQGRMNQKIMGARKMSYDFCFFFFASFDLRRLMLLPPP